MSQNYGTFSLSLGVLIVEEFSRLKLGFGPLDLYTVVRFE